MKCKLCRLGKDIFRLANLVLELYEVYLVEYC